MKHRAVTSSRLKLQGFECDLDPGILAAARWLRFTPVLSTVCIVVGTALRSPLVLGGFATVAALGAAGWHPFDGLFNTVLRRWLNAPALPPNPAPRRFAMALAAAWSAGAAWLFSAGWVWTGLLAGSTLALAAALVATTHFCLGSWVYQILRRRKAPKMAA